MQNMQDEKKIIIGSRESRLAVAQSLSVAEYINQSRTGFHAELLTMKTTGDRILDRTLDKVGGKGLFVKELDLALKDGRTDLSVHSLKDVPMETDPDLPLIAFSKREDPRDVLVLPCSSESRNTETDMMPDPALPIGSSSLRRVLQLKELFPGYKIESVRGNLQTRLRKLDEGQYGALVLAAAGIKRLGLEERISRYFSIEEILPAAGQGILAIQGRAGKDYSFLEGYADKKAEAEALCERAYVRELNGGCTSPVCAYAVADEDRIVLRGLYYDEVSGRYIKGILEGSVSQPEQLGQMLARKLQEQLLGDRK